jgi:thiol-disulfide isomerase/thioredoxin
VSEAQAVLDAARAKAKSVMAARTAHIQAGKNTKDFHGDCAKELAELEARLATEQRPPVLSALLVSRLFLLQLAKQLPDTAFVTRIHHQVSPVDPAWSLDPGLLTALDEDNPEAWDPYVAKARNGHPDPAVRRPLLFDYFWDRLDAKDEAAWKPAFETLQKEFAGSREAKQAQGIYEAEQKTGVGRSAPAFSVKALGDAQTTYSLASFQGRYLLLDFWATWCPPCRAEMPNMHAAWARFKGKPFDILSLSFDRKVEHIAPYRAQAATPMPWKHAFIEGGFLNPLSEAYGVKGIPKPLLIGPDGRIVASGSDLRGLNLEKTLAKFLGD